VGDLLLECLLSVQIDLPGCPSKRGSRDPAIWYRKVGPYVKKNPPKQKNRKKNKGGEGRQKRPISGFKFFHGQSKIAWNDPKPRDAKEKKEEMGSCL